MYSLCLCVQEIGFDYLRDNISQQRESQVLRWYLSASLMVISMHQYDRILKFTPLAAIFCIMNRPRPFNFAIIDEVDSVLIDEGRNPLIISTTVKFFSSLLIGLAA